MQQHYQICLEKRQDAEFVFYDMDTYKADEAIRLSEDYQTKE